MTRCWSIHREITDGRTEGGAAGRVDNAYVGLTLIPVIDSLQVLWQVWVVSGLSVEAIGESIRGPR